MIVRVGLAPRRAGSTVVQFQRHWRDEHGDLALHIPNLRGYWQNHAVLDERARPLLPYPGFDACSEIAFDDVASMDAGFASPHYQRLVRADEDLLIDKSRFWFLLCERAVLTSAPAGLVTSAAAGPEPVRLLTFVRAHPLVSPEQLLEIARGPYAALVAEAGALRHEQLVPLRAAHEGRTSPHCELVDAVTFATIGQALDFVNGTVGERADTLLAGAVFGRERLLARVRVVKPFPDEDEEGVADAGLRAER
jgi:uncharacterized protein (TIGR02118 family)